MWGRRRFVFYLDKVSLPLKVEAPCNSETPMSAYNNDYYYFMQKGF